MEVELGDRLWVDGVEGGRLAEVVGGEELLHRCAEVPVPDPTGPPAARVVRTRSAGLLHMAPT
jgi:hypothetical protein